MDVNVLEVDITDPACLEQLADVLAGVMREALIEALTKAVEHGCTVEELAHFTAEFAEQASSGWEVPTH